MSAIMAARVVGCSQVIALDLTESRLALARELGATHTIKVEKSDTPAKTAAVPITHCFFSPSQPYSTTD